MASFRPLVWCDRQQAIRELRDGETLMGLPTGASAPAVNFERDTFAAMAGKPDCPEGGPSLMDSGIRAVNNMTAAPLGLDFDWPTTAIAREGV